MNRFLPLLFLLFGISVVAQENCTYRGMLLDSLNLPIYDASITAFDANNQSAGFTFSDQEGEFKLDLKCNQNYELEIEHLSYLPLVHKVSLDNSKREKIILKKSTVQLKDVIAKADVPIKMKGDTIEYNADSFKTGQEEDLEDILKKLPGIQVEDGKVFYQGKQINSIKVEGREIFGGNTKLLTKNLPSDAVDKIQLNKKFKGNPFANSLQDEDQPELNITLKEDKKNLIFGNLSLGGDSQEHYDVQEKLFRFSRKTDATLISDFNTYGKEVFTNEDYFQFLGGISELTEEGGDMALRNSIGNIMFSTGEKASEMKNHLGAFHFGYEPNKRLNINGFTMATDNRLKFNSKTQRIYPELTQTDVNQNVRDIFSFLSRIKMDYSFKNKASLKYRINFNQQETDFTTDINTFFDNQTEISQSQTSQEKRKNYNVFQRLSYIKKIGEDDNVGFYFNHSYQKENPNLSLQSTEVLFPLLFDLPQDENGYQINQFSELNSNTFQGLGIYNHLITNMSNIRFKIGANVNQQSFESQINDRIQPIDNDFSAADMDFDFTELFADVTYTRKIKKMKLDIGSGIHRYDFKNQGKQPGTKENLIKFLPHLEMVYDFNGSKSITFNYQKTYEIPQVRELTEAYNLQNYYSIFLGNSALKESQYHQSNLSYRYFNYFKFLNIYLNVSYAKKLDNIRTAGTIQDFVQLSTPFNSQLPEDSWAASIYTTKRFSKVYSLKLNANGNWSTFGSRNNNIDLENQSNMYFSQLTNTFKIKKKLEIDAGLNVMYNNYENDFLKNEFTNIKPFGNLAWVVTDKLLLQSDYQFNNQYANGDIINQNHDWNASLRFKPAKKVYTYFTVGNILNNNQIVNNSFNDFYTLINTKETLGRYFIASVKYKF